MTNAALLGVDCIFDIIHPDGKIARRAKYTAERAIMAAANDD